MANRSEPQVPSDRRLLEAILRNYLPSLIAKAFSQLDPGTTFLPNWHIDAIAWHLEQVRLGRIRRLIITMPPRSLKSIAASVAFPAFVHAHHPDRRLICVSYASDLATKLHNDYRAVLRSPWYRELFPQTRIRRDSESETVLTATGGRLATSVGGVITGLGADIIVIDDPLKASDAMSLPRREAVNNWFRSTLISRQNDKKTGAIVIVTQRLHMDDLVGYVLGGEEAWTVLELPAIASSDRRIQIGDDRWHMFRAEEVLHPEREPREVLEGLRRELGSYAFSAQYLQQPVPLGGNMFKRSWIRRYDRCPPLGEGQIVQSWDTAGKTATTNDWSVCVTLLRWKGAFYILDVTRERLDYPALKQKAVALARQYRPRMVLVEDAGVGTALIAELRHLGINVRSVSATIGKEARAAVEAAKFEGGRVLLPAKARWLPDFEAELFSFPGGRHDDQVDALCQALAYNVPTLAATKVYVVGVDGRVVPARLPRR